MGIGYKNIKRTSKLYDKYIDVAFNNTAGYSLSAGYQGHVIVPFNSRLKKVLFANDLDITASSGIDIGVCNATNDIVYLAVAEAGHLWSGSRTTAPMYVTGSLDWTANVCAFINPTASYMSAGCLIHVDVSATIGASPIAVQLVIEPDGTVK